MGDKSSSVDADARKTRWSLVALLVGGVIAVAAVVTTVISVSGPRPDAVLQQVTDEVDVPVIAMLAVEEPQLEIVVLSLRGYEPYREMELWSGVNDYDSPCLVAVHRETQDVVAASCIPSPGELYVDTMRHGIPDGARIRFTLRGDEVEARLLMPDGAQ